MAYMCKLFGILHIIYKQTIDTLVCRRRHPPVSTRWIQLYWRPKQRQIPIMHMHHIISRLLLFEHRVYDARTYVARIMLHTIIIIFETFGVKISTNRFSKGDFMVKLITQNAFDRRLNQFVVISIFSIAFCLFQRF